MRRSTTGRTRRRSGGATCPTGAAWERPRRGTQLGCGTGCVTIPLAKSGVDVVGLDRSQPMLARLRRRSKVARAVRADIRSLPFKASRFAMVLAPYGVLQSLIRESDVAETLDSVARVLRRGGTFGIDLVPDVPNWREYDNKVQLRGHATDGARLTLVESVRQDRRRRLTISSRRPSNVAAVANRAIASS